MQLSQNIILLTIRTDNGLKKKIRDNGPTKGVMVKHKSCMILKGEDIV